MYRFEKLNLLELVEVIENISEVCRLGLSQQHYCYIKQAIEEDGLQGDFREFSESSLDSEQSSTLIKTKGAGGTRSI